MVYCCIGNRWRALSLSLSCSVNALGFVLSLSRLLYYGLLLHPRYRSRSLPLSTLYYVYCCIGAMRYCSHSCSLSLSLLGMFIVVSGNNGDSMRPRGIDGLGGEGMIG